MARMIQQMTAEEGWAEGGARHGTRDRAFRGPAAAPSSDAVRRAVLVRAVETDVIPRLLMARRPQVALTPRRAVEPHPPTAGHIADLIELLLTGEPERAGRFVDAMRAEGTSPESIYLDLLTPAARRLGVLWEEDICDFAQVTVGLLRLQQVMRQLTPAFIGDIDLRKKGPRALLIQAPGEQHGFGLAMVVQFFSRAGWDVWSEPVATGADLAEMVRHEHVDIVGISCGCGERLDRVAADIRAVRRASRNRDVGVMVGGPPFIEHPQLAAMLGADATASDGRQAVQQAHSLVALLSRSRGDT